MSNQTQQQIDALIQFINDAEDPGTVTNLIVAAVLAYLADKIKNMATTSQLESEATTRQTVDASLQAAIANEATARQNAVSVEAAARVQADEQLQAAIASINTLLSGNVTDAIESLQEVLTFLNGIKDNETLSGRLLLLQNSIDNQSSLVSALQAALANKADVVSIGSSKKLLFSHLPNLGLASIEKIHDDAAPDDKVWWSYEDGRLKYKHDGAVTNLTNSAYLPYILYYCGDKIYRWNGDGFSLMSDINALATAINSITSEAAARQQGDSQLQTSINSEATAREQADNLIVNRMMTVLDGMELPQIQQPGKLYFNPNTNQLVHWYRSVSGDSMSNIVTELINPVTNGLYFDKSTSTFYEWNGAAMVQLENITGNGQITNINDNQRYRLWIGTQEDLDDLEEYEEDVIYLVGVIPAVAQKFNVTLNLTNCSVPQGTASKVTEGAAFSVTVSPQNGHTIDTCTGSMVGGTLAKTVNNNGTVTFSSPSVTGAISITASATVHITQLSVSVGSQIGNDILLSAVITPNNLTGATFAWSVPANTTKFTLIDNQDGTATIRLLSGAYAEDAVDVTCVATNAQGTSSQTQTVTVEATSDYENVVPITNLSDVSHENGQASNTFQFSVVVTPAGGNTPAIVWSVVSIPNGAATIDSATGLLTITEDCSVVVTATAGEYSASSDSIPLTFEQTGVIPFVDDYMHRAMNALVMGNESINVTYEEAKDYENANLSYQYSAGSAITVIKNVAGPNAKHFDEYKYFKAARNMNFKGYPKLITLTLPHGYVVVVANSSSYLQNMPKLRELVFDYDPNSAVVAPTTIPDGGLYDIPYLIKLVLPPTITQLTSSSAGGSIRGLSSLQVLDLRNTAITQISGTSRMFQLCNKLKLIRLPETFQTVGASSSVQFRNNCVSFLEINGTSLTKLRISRYEMNTSNPASVLNLIFTSTTVPPGVSGSSVSVESGPGLGNIYVPDESITAYKTALGSSLEGKVKGVSELPANWDKTMFNISMTGVTDTAASPVTSVECWGSFSTTIEANEGNSLENAKVMMCGENITSSVLNTTTGALNIPSVEGNVTITIETPTE